MRFKSKINAKAIFAIVGWRLLLVTAFFSLALSCKDVIELIALSLMIIGMCILSIPSLFGIFYEIKGNLLVLHSVGAKKEINISSINKIQYVNTFAADHYCLSSEKIKLVMDDDKNVFVSPLENDKFINEILSINSNIKF